MSLTCFRKDVSCEGRVWRHVVTDGCDEEMTIPSCGMHWRASDFRYRERRN